MGPVPGIELAVLGQHSLDVLECWEEIVIMRHLTGLSHPGSNPGLPPYYSDVVYLMLSGRMVHYF